MDISAIRGRGSDASIMALRISMFYWKLFPREDGSGHDACLLCCYLDTLCQALDDDSIISVSGSGKLKQHFSCWLCQLWFL